MNTDTMSYIGQKAEYTLEGPMTVIVKIVDAKMGYGRLRFLIEPMRGHGQKWVESTSVTLL